MNLLILSDLLAVSNCFLKGLQMKVRNLLVGAGALIASAVSFAQSATTTAFTSSVTAVSGDIATFGAALIGVAAVGVGFMVGMKYVKKIRSAA